jgi:hypothetical protein
MKKLKCPEGGLTYKVPGQDPIFADPEFQGLQDSLTPAELRTLEANIIADGRALDPIVVWQEARIILDGHNRIAICVERKLPYKLSMMKFPLTPEGRTKALQWAVDHQLGRRNLSADAKSKMADWRRERVAAARQAGESTRAIAEKENISQKQVMRDLDALTESGDSVQPASGVVNSKDGIQRPAQSRAERVGQKPVPTFVPRGERMPGDDTDQIERDKQEARSDPKNGKLEFDWAKFHRDFANFILNVCKFGKVYKKHNSIEAEKLRKRLLDWKDDFKAWTKDISKKEPPPDVVDRMLAGK